MRKLIRAGGVALLALSTATAGVVALGLTSRPAAAAGPPAGQIITVQAASPTSTSARLDAWVATGSGGYRHALGPFTARIGELGVGQTREGIARTPAGVFSLTLAFGNQPNNGTHLPYFQANSLDWWNGESGSRAYNTHVHQVASPGSASENLYYAGAVYAHAVVIDYNRFPVVAGAGSAFFLHVTNGYPTAGCVAIAGAYLDAIMRWLTPGQRPIISIGVGAAATAPVNNANLKAAQHNPKGYLDSVTGGHGSVHVVGWAADPDQLNAQLLVDFHLDGLMRGRFPTGVPRPDVAAAQHTGPNQGYAFTVTGIAPGRHTACVFANNIHTGTGATESRCLVVTTS